MLDGELVFEVGFAWCMILWTYVVADGASTCRLRRHGNRARRIRHHPLYDEADEG